MKLLQINAVYGYGSTGHIVEDIHKAAQKKGWTSYVFWATKCTNEGLEDKNVRRVGNTFDHKCHALWRRLLYNQAFNSKLSTYFLCRELKRLQPDAVHLHNLHSNYININILLSFLAKAHIPTFITLHDCWFFTGNCTHFLEHSNCRQWSEGKCSDCPAYSSSFAKRQTAKQYLNKEKLFAKIENLSVVGVSNWITDCGKMSLLSGASRFFMVYNWIDTDVFRPFDTLFVVKSRYNIPKDKRIIIGVSQNWSDQKGLKEFELLGDRFSEQAVIILVGERPKIPLADNIKAVGFTNSTTELAELYSAADVLVNPSRMETFGKVTAEALACGTPVVAYDNTGTSELISEEVGVLVPDGDKDKMLAAVSSVLERKKEFYSENCRRVAKDRFDRNKLIELQLGIYGEQIKPVR